MTMHTHTPEEMGASAWASKDELLLHFSAGHHMLLGPVGKDLERLARIHAEEHPPELLTRDGMTVRENAYVQEGRTLYKVSTVYAHRVTLVVCLENGQTPPRTSVRPLSRDRVAQMTSASDRIVDQYHAILDAGRQP